MRFLEWLSEQERQCNLVAMLVALVIALQPLCLLALTFHALKMI